MRLILAYAITTSVVAGFAVLAIAFAVTTRPKKQRPQAGAENQIILGGFAAKVESVSFFEVGEDETELILKLCVSNRDMKTLYNGASIAIADEVAVALFATRRDGDDEPAG